MNIVTRGFGAYSQIASQGYSSLYLTDEYAPTRKSKKKKITLTEYKLEVLCPILINGKYSFSLDMPVIIHKMIKSKSIHQPIIMLKSEHYGFYAEVDNQRLKKIYKILKRL